MRIKRFRAPDMRTALELVRAEMGRDAVILQSRAVRGRGLLGWLGRGRRWVEVTAAWDGDEPRAGLPAGRDRAPAGGSGAVRPAGGGAASRPPRAVAGGDGWGRGEPSAAARTGEGSDRGDGWTDGAPPARSAAAADGAAIPAPPPRGPLPGAPPDGLSRRLDVAVGEGPLIPSPTTARRQPGPRAEAPARAGPTAASPVLPPPAPPLRGTVVVVGPTGAGKTTVVANLAARAVLDEGREVALLAADTYRLGATQALASYAELLGLPLEVAYAPGEVAAWADRQRGRCGARGGAVADAGVDDGGEGGVHALVDTAGRNLLLPEVAAELAAVVSAARPDRVLLVVPATLAPGEAAAVVAAGRRLGVTDLVLTKLDECLAPAAALARAAGWGLPLARVGVGQRVPEDLLPGTPEALAPWLAHARRQDRGGGGLHGHDAVRVG